MCTGGGQFTGPGRRNEWVRQEHGVPQHGAIHHPAQRCRLRCGGRDCPGQGESCCTADTCRRGACIFVAIPCRLEGICSKKMHANHHFLLFLAVYQETASHTELRRRYTRVCCCWCGHLLAGVFALIDLWAKIECSLRSYLVLACSCLGSSWSTSTSAASSPRHSAAIWCSRPRPTLPGHAATSNNQKDSILCETAFDITSAKNAGEEL